MILKLVKDIWGLSRVVGVPKTFRWAGAIAATFPQVLKRRDLASADARLAGGPIRVRHPLGTAVLSGPEVFAGIREIWVRDVYGMRDLVKLRDGATVVDLGANAGNFSVLVLTACPTARVIAVEAHKDRIALLERNAALNGVSDRVTTCRAFIGVDTEVQDELRKDEQFAGAPTMSEQELLDRFDLETIDLLKCDIEGSEFAFLEPDSILFDRCRQVVVEIHEFGGDLRRFLDVLRGKGFRIAREDWVGTTCTAIALR
jgi:FkbM family methyltransferase